MAGFCGAAMLAACSTRPPEQPAAVPQAMPFSPPAPAALMPPLTLDGYKRALAEQVARVSPEMFSDPVPDMLKSVVVLEISIGHDGRLLNVAVRRSNGFTALENLAMESVRRAAPYQPPSWAVRRGEGSVRFLETFLFRNDGRFRIRSLVTSAPVTRRDIVAGAPVAP